MKFVEYEGLTFDDVLLVPQLSDVESRKDVTLAGRLGSLHLDYPIISANMDCITGHDMAVAMEHAGALGVIHRYQPPQETIKTLSTLGHGIPSIGVLDDDRAVARMYREFTDTICIDVAHGHHRLVAEMVSHCRTKLDYKNIIAGNIAAKEGVRYLWDAGANIIKVGIGPSRVCSTRGVTGHGVPQLTAIGECASWAKLVSPKIFIIADGGMDGSGDIVKALGAGAHAVMSGSLFAGCKEAAMPTVYRGMASFEAQSKRGKLSGVEGVSMNVLPKSKTAAQILEELAAGIRSGLSYSGAHNLAEFREVAKFVRVTPHTRHENATRSF